MARITGPAELTIPSVLIQGVPLMLPVDLPEGGTLQLVAGQSALAPPSRFLPLPRGCMVGLFAPEVVAQMFPHLKPADKNQEPTVAMPNLDLFGIQLGGVLWLPEGGFLNVVVGQNPTAMPTPSTPLMPNSILCVIAPETAEQFRAGVAGIGKTNPFAVLPGSEPVH